MRKINSNVKVNVIDNRKNGGNYKWQIEKLDVILDFFNDDFFNVYPNVKVNVIVNSEEVFPKMIVNGVSVFPDYIRYFKAFSKSKKEMVEEMNYMVEMMNNELNNKVDMVNEVKTVNFNCFEMNMVDMTKMEEKTFTCDDAVKQIDALIDFVMNEGEGMSIRDVKNIIESVDRIYENVQKSDDVDSKTKDNLWYWDKEMHCINDIVYRLESGLFNIKDVLE